MGSGFHEFHERRRPPNGTDGPRGGPVCLGAFGAEFQTGSELGDRRRFPY